MEGDINVTFFIIIGVEYYSSGFKWWPNDETGVSESVKVHAGKLVWLTPSYECALLLVFFASF
jgi:hypothetical protein